MDVKRRFLRETLFVFGFSLLGVLIAFLTRVLYTHTIPVAEYGVLYAVIALFTIIMPFKNFGVTNAAVFFLPGYVEKHPKKVRSILLLVSAVVFCTSLVIAALAVILRGTLASVIFHSTLAADLVILIAFYFLGSSFREVMTTLFQGYQETLAYGSSDTVRTGTILVLSAVFLYAFHWGVLGIGLAWALSPIADLAYWAFFLRSHRAVLQGSWRWDPAANKQLGKYAREILLSTLGLATIASLDVLLVNALRGATDSGLYNAAIPLASLLLFFTTPLKLVMMPMTAHFTHQKDDSFVRQSMGLLGKFSMLLLLPAALILALYPQSLLVLFFGNAYLGAALALRVLAAAFFFRALGEVYFSIIAGLGKPRQRTYIMLVGIGINLVLDLILIPTLGIAGAAIAALAAFIVIWAWCRYVIGGAVFSRKDVLKSLGGIVVFVGAVAILKDVLPSALWAAAVSVVIAGILYVAYLWYARIVGRPELRLLREALLNQNR